MPTLRLRFPDLAASLTAELETGLEDRLCVSEVLAAGRLLHSEGFRPPSYVELTEGAKPPEPEHAHLAVGDWKHRW